MTFGPTQEGTLGRRGWSALSCFHPERKGFFFPGWRWVDIGGIFNQRSGWRGQLRDGEGPGNKAGRGSPCLSVSLVQVPRIFEGPSAEYSVLHMQNTHAQHLAWKKNRGSFLLRVSSPASARQ